eukprot:2282050-Karenia_brevis.AAC.1
MTRMTAEVNLVESKENQEGGFLPVQWIIDRQPRVGAETAGYEAAVQHNSFGEKVNPTTTFAERMALRQKAKKTSMEPNLSQRVARAALRKAAPMTGEYRVGDLTLFQREQGTHGVLSKRWSPAARIIGFGG